MIVDLELSTQGIQAAQKAISDYKKSLEAKADELCRRLAEIGVEAAVNIVRVDTGELESSIEYEKHGQREYLVITRNDHAAFVEFGTGVVGEGTYGFDLPSDWEYDTRATPSAHDRDDPTLWYYTDPESGGAVPTRGQTANAYMAYAGQEIRSQIVAIAKEVFR